MTDINDINNLLIIDSEPYINWVIDRIPHYNLINNINNSDEYNNNNNNTQFGDIFQNQYDLAYQALINEYQAHQNNLDYDNNIILPDNNVGIGNQNVPDDFIPFEPQPKPPNHIVIEVQEFPISEEDCDCCICMDTRENDQICQFNCLHKFCIECALTHYRRNMQQPFCPLCRTPVTNIYIRTEEMRNTFI